MARFARERSETGIYHVMLRGIDKRDIFLEDEDKQTFIDKVIKVKERVGAEVYGYCLMDNHVHLLIKENEELGITIKRVAGGYVQWHNNKYGRTGHLFQNRYLSEPVETESYLINVLRYIHQNPIKANITRNLNDFSWSSYDQYLLAYRNEDVWVDVDLIKDYFKRQDDFVEYMNASNNFNCLEHNPTIRYDDNTLKKIISNIVDVSNIHRMTVEERSKTIKDLYKKTGVSIRQLSRVLNLSKKSIEIALK